MYEEEIRQINKFCSPLELYVITPKGNLVKVYCPIKVVCIKSVGRLKAGQLVYVDEVRITNTLILVYQIGKAAYYYYCFRIVVLKP